MHFGKAVGLAACTGRPTLGGLLVELLEDPQLIPRDWIRYPAFTNTLRRLFLGVFGPAVAMQPAPNFSEAGGPRRRLPMIQRRKFATGRTRLFLSSPAWLPVNPNRKSLTKTLSASEAWGVLLTRRDDYLPVNLLYRHRQAGGVNLAGDHSLFIDLCSLHRSLLERDVTFALTFVPRGRIRQIGTLKDSVQAALLGRFCFWSKGVRRPV